MCYNFGMPAAKKTAAKKTAKETAPEAVEEVIPNEEPVEETAPEAVEDAAPARVATVARVYSRHMKLMRTYTLEQHGKDFIEQAEAFATHPTNPPRIGWQVIVQ